jgi:DNA invertase Pin-like site-specific DNA recombinase
MEPIMDKDLQDPNPPEEDRLMKIAGYCRISTDNQTNDTQRTQIERYVQAHGQGIHASDLEIYEDVISGAKSTRPALDKMMQRIRSGEINLVITAYLSRLGRSQAHLIQILEELKNRNVRYVSLNDGIDTGTPTGRLLFGILSALAEHERELIRERTALRIARIREKGGSLGRPRKWDDAGRRTRILNLVKNKPEISIRDIQDITGWSRSGIHSLIKKDPEISEIWKGQENNGNWTRRIKA